MSSPKSAAPLTLDLRPSRRLLLILTAVHGLAGVALWLCALPLAVKIPLSLLLGGSLLSVYPRYAHRRSRFFIARIRQAADGQWFLGYGDGGERPARLAGGYVHPQLLILNFATGRLARRAVVILPDAADAEAVRRLRVRLLARRAEEE